MRSFLLVDDSRMQRKVLKGKLDALMGEGSCSYQEAENGREALDRLREARYDLMFLDLTMPEMDGYEVLANMREEGLAVPVVVLSADVQPKAVTRVRELGASAFIKKPASEEHVGATLRKMGIL